MLRSRKFVVVEVLVVGRMGVMLSIGRGDFRLGLLRLWMRIQMVVEGVGGCGWS